MTNLGERVKLQLEGELEAGRQCFARSVYSRRVKPSAFFSATCVLLGGRACFERARGRQPADGRRGYTVGAGEIGLQGAFREPLESLLTLVGG